MKLSPEVQAYIAEIEEQRDLLGARAARYAAQVALLKHAVDERDEAVKTLRAELLKHDGACPAERW